MPRKHPPTVIGKKTAHRHIAAAAACMLALAGASVLLGSSPVMLPRLIIGPIDELAAIDPADWIELRYQGQGVDGVYTATVTFPASAGADLELGYLVVPAEVADGDPDALRKALGLAVADGEAPSPVPVNVPASDSAFEVEVRYAPVAPEGFGPAPSIADSWNTGFSHDDSISAREPMVIVGSFQELLGTGAWDASSEVTRLRDDGAFGDRVRCDGVHTFAFISPVGVGLDEPASWRVAAPALEPGDLTLTLGPAGWMTRDTAEQESFEVRAERWMPARFEVDVLRGMARVTEAPELLDLPMISQMSTLTAQGTYVDVMNTADAVLALEGLYLADDRRYFDLPWEPATVPNRSRFDFNAAFPPGSWIRPSSARTITISTDYEGFVDIHDRAPDFVVNQEPFHPRDMIPAYEDSIGSQRGLTDAGEYVVLYTWAPGMPLVEDLDVVVFGNDSHLFPLKTDIEVGPAVHGEDGGTVNQARAQTSSTAIWRQDFRRKGVHRLFECEAPCPIGDGTGHNGVFHPGVGGRYDATDYSAASAFVRGSSEPGSPALLSLGGTIEDEDGEPMNGVAVTARRGDEVHESTTDSEGAFFLELPLGTWIVGAWEMGYSEARVAVRVDHHKAMAEPITLHVTTTEWTLSGAVKDADGSEPIFGAEVSISAKDVELSTDEDGLFSVDLLEGVYRVAVRATGYRPAVEDVTLGSDVFVTFALRAAAPPVTIGGHVECAVSGAPIDNASVSLDDGAGGVLGVVTDADGSFEITDVPGEMLYTLDIEAAGFESYSSKLMVELEDVTDLLIELEPLPADWTLSGLVVSDRDAQPIAGAAVEVEGAGDAIRSVATDSEGAYLMTGLSGGSYRVTASAGGHVSEAMDIVISGDETLDFQLSPTAQPLFSITGTVALEGEPEGQWAGTIVTTGGPKTLSVLTNDEGRFRIEGLPAGAYQLELSRAGYEGLAQSVTLMGDLELEFTLLPAPEEEDGPTCLCVSTGGSTSSALLAAVLLGLLVLSRPARRVSTSG